MGNQVDRPVACWLREENVTVTCGRFQDDLSLRLISCPLSLLTMELLGTTGLVFKGSFAIAVLFL